MEKEELIKQFKEMMDLGEKWDKWIDSLFERNPNFSDLGEMFQILNREIQPAINALANRVLNHQLGIE